MHLIILGASARAAAFSAHRAGLQPWCADLFADADLARRFPVRRVAIHDYPHGLLAALADAPDGPVLYTGGLENYPDLIACIDRPLWGNPPEVLRRVRSPFLLADALRRHGWPALEVRRDPPPAGDRRRWLRKPLRGSGGVGIRGYDGQPFDPNSYYLQERADGQATGAVFVGIPGVGAIVLGTTWMLDVDWVHAPPFHYAGGVTPNWYCFSRMLQTLGDLLVAEFGLAGLFGVDYVFRYGADVAVLEVNPRYTASVEILERTWDAPLLPLHRAVFEQQPVSWDRPSRGIGRRCQAGKAILYARAALTFPADGPWQEALTAASETVLYADMPQPGERIPRGRPVMTVFSYGETTEGCLGYLQQRTETLDRVLWG